MGHILVVDDDPDIREVLQLALETGEYEVRAAAHGGEALERIEEDVPSLVLLDLMMPVMGGAEFLQRLRADSRFDALPVLVVTAWPQEAAVVSDAQGVLSKPVDIRSLFDQVARFVRPAGAGMQLGELQ